MKTYWAFLAGADSMGMIFAHLIRSSNGFIAFGVLFMVSFYFILFNEAE